MPETRPRWHLFHIVEKGGDGHPRGLRLFAYRGRFEAKLSVYWRKPGRAALSHLGFRLHVGNAGSETPWDAHVQLGVVEVYAELSALRRLATWLGHGHKRDISLSVHDGSLWWKVWFDDDMGYDRHHRCDPWRLAWWSSKRKYRAWRCLRDGHIDLNPVTVLYGRPTYHYENVGEKRTGLVTLGWGPGDEYDVDFQLQRQRLHREDGPRWARRLLRDSWIVDWSADRCGGIPIQNHDWKGDEILASAESLPKGWTPDGPDWLPLAVTSLRERCLRDRARHGYRYDRTPA